MVFLGGLILLMLNRIYDNKQDRVGDRRESDQSIVGVYSELLHITTVVAQIDTGMGELIRLHNDSDSKFATVKLREEMRELRKELNEDIESLRRVIETSKGRD